MAEAARPAGEQGLHLPDQVFPEHEAPDALGAQQALVAGEGQGVDVHVPHVDGPDAGGLGGIHEKAQAVGRAELPHLPQRQQRPTHVAGVGHDHGPGAGGQAAGEGLDPQTPVLCAGDPGKGDASALQLHQRPHDGVVLHSGHQHMVTGLEEALQQDVQTLGDVFGKDHVLAVLPAEQLAQHLPGLVYGLLHAVGPLVTAPVDVAARLRQKAIHGVRHGPGLGKGGAGIVQIDASHASSSLLGVSSLS